MQKTTSIEINTVEGVTVMTLTGSFSRRVPRADFEHVASSLRVEPTPSRLVVDLSSLFAMDSIGEDKIESVLAATVSIGGRAALVINKDRRWLYVGLKPLLDGLGKTATSEETMEAALTFVQATP